MISVPNLDKRIITFIGPEGSGKSTLARKLAEDAQKPFISTGDLIRELAKNDPGPLGEECREMFRNHTYLSPVTLLQILKNRYIQNDMAHGFVVDGGLRTVPETAEYPTFLKSVGRDFPMIVIQLFIPEKISLERLSGRKRDQGDTLEGIKKRLEMYYFQLEKRLELIKSEPSWSLVEIDASGTIEENYMKIYAVLK